MIRVKFSNLWLVIILTSCWSCNNSTPEASDENSSEDTLITHTDTHLDNSAHNARPIHWSYKEDGGPAGWDKLSPVYAACGSGKSQSPVNLLTDVGKGSVEWTVDYKNTSLQIAHHENVQELINNGHTIQVTPQEGSSITYDGKKYHLKQFHFHTPSEHTINGIHFPMEIHLVHESDDKTLAVIGVLVREGNHNKNFDQLIKYLPNAAGEKQKYDSVNIEIGVHVPKEMDAWHYVGSLTTPPCSENVQWLVMKNPISLERKQITAFSSRLKNNNRPVQKINERKLTMDHGRSVN